MFRDQAIRLAVALALGLVLVAESVSPAAQAPDPVTFTLRLAGDRKQFRPGEIIPIELTFASSIPNRFVVDGAGYDRGGRLTIDEFRLAPIALVTDPMLDYFGTAGGFLGGGIRGIGRLGEQPYTVTLELNEWFRFDTPGTFTLSMRTDRVTDETIRTSNARPVVPVVSNAIAFEIVPRDLRWEDAEFERARQMVNRSQTTDHRAGCRILRFLGTNAAVDEMVRRYDDQECGFDVMAGLFSAPDRAHVVQQLEAGLGDPDQAVTRSYLRTLSLLSIYLRQPELRPSQTAETKGRLITGGALTRQPEAVQAEIERYTQLFEAALPQKRGTARAVSSAEYAEIVRSRPSATATASEVARRQLISSFAELPASRQESLLTYQWRSIADPSLLPTLRQLAAGTGQLAELALRRIYQLAPDEGRTRIIEMIRRPQPLSRLQTLGMLPDATLPELDEILARNAETATDLGMFEITVALLHRYASAAIAPRMLKSIPQVVGPAFACAPQAYGLAYFLRTLPQQGAELLDRALAARDRTSCYQRVLLDTAQHRMTPELETRAIAALDDEHPRVVQNAIETLGRFGSPAAAAPLRARFDTWHRAWQGRAGELLINQAAGPDDPGAVNRMIEAAYLRALAAPLGWLTSETEILALRDWCVTEDCRRNAEVLAVQARETTTIDVSTLNGYAEFQGRVAQYSIDSLSALARKLSQYPKGTTFTVRSGSDPETARAVTAELAAWGEPRGLTITRMP